MRAVAALLVLGLAVQSPAVHLDTGTYESRVFGGPRRVRTYLPPKDAPRKTPPGLLICFWGHDYVGQIGAPETLDSLIRAGRIPPLAAVFLDDPDDRFQSFETTQKVARSVADELIPWARRTLGVPGDAPHTIVAGYSASGLGATYAAYAHPSTFGNVLSQSGAFWRGFEGEGAAELQWVATQFASAPTRGTRVYLEVGGAETRPAGGTPVSIKAANEHLRDVLTQKGYDLTYVEVPGAQHEYGHWKAAFGPGLIALTKDWK